MRLVQHVKETDYKKVQDIIQYPEITRIEYAIWTHLGHIIEITEDNLQLYARIDGSFAHICTDYLDAVDWIQTKLNGDTTDWIGERLMAEVNTWKK